MRRRIACVFLLFLAIYFVSYLIPIELKPFLSKTMLNTKINMAKKRGSLLHNLLLQNLIVDGYMPFMRFTSAKEIYQFLIINHPDLQQEIVDSSLGFHFSCKSSKNVLRDGWLIVIYRKPNISLPFLISCDNSVFQLLFSFYNLSLRRFYYKTLVSTSQYHVLPMVMTTGTIIPFSFDSKEQMFNIDINFDLFNDDCVIFTLDNRFLFNYRIDE